jgi:hypothetical protein
LDVNVNEWSRVRSRGADTDGAGGLSGGADRILPLPFGVSTALLEPELEDLPGPGSFPLPTLPHACGYRKLAPAQVGMKITVRAQPLPKQRETPQQWRGVG